MRDRVRRVLENGPLLSAAVISATFAFHLLYVIPATRHVAAALLSEDQVVEDVTFVALLLASLLGGLLALRTRRAGRPLLVWGFFLVFAIGVFFVAMEEISWGQWLFFFKTPHSWATLNRQGETNLHNLPGLWGRSEWLRLLFAGGGLVGVLANRRASLRPIATPAQLTGWFAFMTAYVVVDAVNDFARGSWILGTFSPMSEWVEMLIGLGALAYVLIKRAEFVGSAPDRGLPTEVRRRDRITVS